MATAEPKLRSDLVTSRQDGFVVVKDPSAGQFFRFREVEHFIASQLDGSASLGEIRDRAQQTFGAAPTPDVLEGFVATLAPERAAQLLAAPDVDEIVSLVGRRAVG